MAKKRARSGERVNHPKHYTSHPSGVECIEVVEHMTFCLGNVFKYCWRAGQKDGETELQDLRKAAWYLEREISVLNDWRNSPTRRLCRVCTAAFVGKYNSSTCPSCRSVSKMRAHAAFKNSNPDYFREKQVQRRISGVAWRGTLRRVYGISVGEYDDMKRKQNGRCGICDAQEGGWKANAGKLVIDHCHRLGVVRGLLCPSCNRGLGQFCDDPSRMMNAVKYLLCAGFKNGSPSIEDIRKARWYCNQEVARLERAARKR